MGVKYFLNSLLFLPEYRKIDSVGAKIISRVFWPRGSLVAVTQSLQLQQLLALLQQCDALTCYTVMASPWSDFVFTPTKLLQGLNRIETASHRSALQDCENRDWLLCIIWTNQAKGWTPSYSRIILPNEIGSKISLMIFNHIF